MAISSYTRAPKEIPIGVDINKQLTQFSNIYRQKQLQEEQERKQSEVEYLQQAKVDPVYNMSTYWQKKQGNQIEEFQDFLTDVYYRSGNKPTLQDRIEIQSHKDALFSWQQQAKANQDKYTQAENLISQDPYGIKFDKNNFRKKVINWLSTGELDDDLLLPPRVGDLKGYYSQKEPWKGTRQQSVTKKDGKIITEEVPMSEQEMKEQSKYDLFDPKHSGLYRTVTEDFNSLLDAEKNKYLAKYKGEDDQRGNAIVDWNWENNAKLAFKPKIDEKFAPKGREVSGQILTGNINYETPSDVISINASKIPGVSKNKDVDVWGNYSFPGSIAGVATARDYYDMETGEKQKVEVGNDIILKYPEIKYVPVVGNKMIVSKDVPYRNEDGSLKSGYKLKAILITRTEEGVSKGLDFTPELKNKLKDRFKKLSKEIDQIPYDITPKGKQKAEESGIKITKQTKIAPEKTATNKSTGEKMYQYKGKWYSKQEFDNVK